MGFFSSSEPERSSAPSPGSEETMLRAIIASMEDALVVYDQNFKVELVNPAATRLFGLDAKELMSQTLNPRQVEEPRLARLIQIIFPTLAPAIIPRSKSGEYPQIVDISFEDPPLEVRTVTAPVPGLAGETHGFMKIIRDRTSEVELIKAKTDFITVASHQLRTPITNLKWSLETIAGEEGLNPQMKEVIQGAQESARTLQIIVEDLLSVTKIAEGRFGYNFEPTNIAEYLQTFLANVLPQAKRVGISLYFDPPAAPLPQVFIDRQKIGMVLQNLLDNAIRYNVANGSVTFTVEAKTDSPHVTVNVQDTGIGIPQEEAAKLFTKFYRASNAVKSAADGSGLGLYIVKKIIQAHGSQIWVESELNRGTTFHFTVPTDPSILPPREIPEEL